MARATQTIVENSRETSGSNGTSCLLTSKTPVGTLNVREINFVFLTFEPFEIKAKKYKHHLVLYVNHVRVTKSKRHDVQRRGNVGWKEDVGKWEALKKSLEQIALRLPSPIPSSQRGPKRKHAFLTVSTRT